MGNIMIPTTTAVGGKDTRFLSDQYKNIGNSKIDQGTLLIYTNGSVDL